MCVAGVMHHAGRSKGVYLLERHARTGKAQQLLLSQLRNWRLPTGMQQKPHAWLLTAPELSACCWLQAASTPLLSPPRG
jgi:hypothetical protein